MKFPDAMTAPPVPASPEKSRIPVMFSATGGWGLPLAVAIHTLCLHASSGRFYDIHIVHDGMDARIIQELNQVAAATWNTGCSNSFGTARNPSPIRTRTS